MNTKFLFTLLFLGVFIGSNAQSTFYSSGTIKYQRKVNAFRLTEETWMNRQFEKNKFQTDTFQLSFDSMHSLYFNPSFDPEMMNEDEMYWAMSVTPTKSNVVYKTHNNDSVSVIRDLFDERLMIQDSIRRPNWKITGETREIAGFHCHKAVCVLFDSVFVVAFFTDQITTRSGPESFGGLPGMIMEVAIPRLFISWIAVDFKPGIPEIKKPVIPKKKKTHLNWNSYYLKVTERFKSWGPPFNTLLVWMWGV